MKKTYSTPLVTASDIVRATEQGITKRPFAETNTLTTSHV